MMTWSYWRSLIPRKEGAELQSDKTACQTESRFMEESGEDLTPTATSTTQEGLEQDLFISI